MDETTGGADMFMSNEEVDAFLVEAGHDVPDDTDYSTKRIVVRWLLDSAPSQPDPKRQRPSPTTPT